MKRLLTCIFTAASIFVLFQSCEQRSAWNAPSEEEVEKNIQAYQKAFNSHDIEELSALWSPEGDYVNLTRQETVEGSQQITDYFKELFDEKKAQAISLEVCKISFPTADTAIAKGLGTTTYEDNTTKDHAFVVEYIKEKGVWTIQSYREDETSKPTSHFEELKELAWLVGNWEDEDNDIDVEYVVDWDLNKNFLVQEFILSVLDQEILSGKQIIGWDPIEKGILSWIFDSDGGFGSCLWTKENSAWYAAVSFKLSSGEVSSATHVYTLIDKDTYTFASINRDVAGALLPNIGPFKVIRKKTGPL